MFVEQASETYNINSNSSMYLLKMYFILKDFVSVKLITGIIQ